MKAASKEQVDRTEWVRNFQAGAFFRRVKDVFKPPASGPERVLLMGMRGGLKPLLVSALARRRTLWVVESLEEAYKVRQDLESFIPGVRIEIFPGPETVDGYILPMAWQEILHRLSSLLLLASEAPSVVISPFSGAMSRTLKPTVFRGALIELERGGRVSLDRMIERLVILGYQRQPNTQTRGEFSVRGGIVDVFPPHQRYPVRVEFFGDEVDEMRQFDPLTQRSREPVDKLVITPSREVLLDRELDKAYALGTLDEDDAAMFRRREREGSPKGAERFLRYLPGQSGRLFDYLEPTDLLVWDVPPREVSRHRAALDGAYGEGYLDEAMGEMSRHPVVGFWPLPVTVEHLPGVETGAELPFSVRGDFERFFAIIKDYLLKGFKVVFAVRTKGNLQRAAELFKERDILHVVGYWEGTDPIVSLIQADLESGFLLEDDKTLVISEYDVWGDRLVQDKQAEVQSTSYSEAFQEFTELEAGSLIVHIDHGVGKFLGLKDLFIDGVKQEYLEIEYAKGDKLYVPVSQLDRVERFIGVEEGKAPALSRLGTARWQSSKNRVKEAVEEMAKKLIEIYARREVSKAIACGPDSIWQQELLEAFPFEATPDQNRTWAQVDEDMQKPRPMDRLVCGDVGFGKTEIAIRAAFKMTEEGRQVAVLVPTTILAQQHYTTFSARLSSFPVTIGVLSRLRSKAEQTRTLNDMEEGKVDIVIGTHRLLSKDIRFKDLGLLIVDEEQRFGVKHKDRIKELRDNVHILSLSATPIPRTLNLTMGGLKDISIINTPPKGRIPIKTYVMEYSDTIVRGAIKRELERGGQVYYVYNRIESLPAVEAFLKRLVPEVRVRVGHGQMSGEQLEKLMDDFYQREFDVLVSTTIVESGLDVPNVNTLIVHDSSVMGLAQLYQLRGRVGRSSRQAFGYFLYPGRTLLTDLAYERLKALEENTELGAGFKIAMRDLELRGAGNLLGDSQSGFIASVGFDMYTRLLREAVAELQERDDLKPLEGSKIDVRVDAYIPTEYVPDADTRVTLYRKLAVVEDTRGLERMHDEIADRFGPIPDRLEALFRVIALKVKASGLGVAEIQQQGQFVILTWGKGRNPPQKWVEDLLDGLLLRVSFVPGASPGIKVDLGMRKNLAVLDCLENLLPSPALL